MQLTSLQGLKTGLGADLSGNMEGTFFLYGRPKGAKLDLSDCISQACSAISGESPANPSLNED